MKISPDKAGKALGKGLVARLKASAPKNHKIHRMLGMLGEIGLTGDAVFDWLGEVAGDALGELLTELAGGEPIEIVAEKVTWQDNRKAEGTDK